MVKITSEDELAAWLETRSDDAKIIAHRALLRIFPLWVRVKGIPSLPILRSMISLWVSSKYRSADAQVATVAAGAGLSLLARPISDRFFIAERYVRATDSKDALHEYGYAWAAADYLSAATANSASKTTTGAIRLHRRFAQTTNYEEWRQVSLDATHLESKRDLSVEPLWIEALPDWFYEAEMESLEHMAGEFGSPNSFWHRWWSAIKNGEPLDWDLQRDIALIPDEVWQKGPQRVMAEIEKIEESHRAKSSPVQPPTPAQVENTRTAMERNRQALPPTFEAIEGLLILEIERLQRSNDHDDAWHRQMQVYLSLYDAVQSLRENLPLVGPVASEQAEQSIGTLQLYMQKFRELPRSKVDEVVEGAWGVGKGVVTAGLIGFTTALAVSYGLPVVAGVAIGSMAFAPKNAAELIKAAREVVLPPK